MKYSEIEDKIFDYLHQSLNAEEMSRIEELISTDPETKSLYESMKIEHALGLHIKEKEILANINKLDRATKQKPKTVQINWSKFLKVAATVFLVPVLGALLYSNLLLKNTDLAKAQIPAPFVLQTMDSDSENDLIFEKAYDLYYSDAEYQKALDLYKTIPESSQHFLSVDYYKAFCNFRLERYQLALRHFLEVKDRNLYFLKGSQELDWMILNCKLALNESDFEASLSQFLDNNPTGEWHQKAKDLQSKLGSPLRKFLFVSE